MLRFRIKHFYRERLHRKHDFHCLTLGCHNSTLLHKSGFQLAVDAVYLRHRTSECHEVPMRQFTILPLRRNSDGCSNYKKNLRTRNKAWVLDPELNICSCLEGLFSPTSEYKPPSSEFIVAAYKRLPKAISCEKIFTRLIRSMCVVSFCRISEFDDARVCQKVSNRLETTGQDRAERIC